ncbi:hypothetical protein Tco_1337188 [Tanacetum coccineum]
MARQSCLGSEVRLQLEHELRGRKTFENKYDMQAILLKERDAEIASLKAHLSLKEAEAAEAIRLRSQVSVVEATKAARASKLNGLKERNAALEGQLSCDKLSFKASSLEFEKDKLVDQVSKLEGTCFELRDEVSDEEFYPCYLTTIAGRRWILSYGLKLIVIKCLQLLKYLAALGEAIGHAIDKGMQVGLAIGIDYGKVRRDLTDVVAYDPSMKANFMSALSALRAVSFQLESHKDASIADLMGLLHLEGSAAETLKSIQLQPSPEQLMLPIHHLEDQLSISDALVPLIEPLSAKNLVGEASTNGVPAIAKTTALSTTFIQAIIVPPVPVIDDEVSDVGPSTKVSSPPAIIFEKETLETTSEHGASD